MTLPKAISDAIDEYRLALLCMADGMAAVDDEVTRAALERAIAEAIACAGDEKIAAWRKAAAEGVRLERIAPVDAPTEAEIEAWKVCAMGWSVDKAKEPPILQPQPDDVGKDGEAFLVVRSEIEEAVALMRRAAAAKPEPFYSCTGRAFRLHSADWNGSQDEMPKSVLIYGSGDMGRGEFANYLRADVAREAAATSTPSALERLRERVRAVAEAKDDAGNFVQDGTTRHAFACVLRWIDEEREAKR